MTGDIPFPSYGPGAFLWDHPAAPYLLTVRLESLKLAIGLYGDIHRADPDLVIAQAAMFERYILGTGDDAPQDIPAPETAEPPPKRKPGRPRKQPLPADTPG